MSNLITGTPVRVYWNFHKNLFSVQAKVDGRWKVVAHVDSLALREVQFKVSEAGRQRVLMERRKNVHAKITGLFTDGLFRETSSYTAKYNPYVFPTFYYQEIEGAKVPMHLAKGVELSIEDNKPIIVAYI